MEPEGQAEIQIPQNDSPKSDGKRKTKRIKPKFVTLPDVPIHFWALTLLFLLLGGVVAVFMNNRLYIFPSENMSEFLEVKGRAKDYFPNQFKKELEFQATQPNITDIHMEEDPKDYCILTKNGIIAYFNVTYTSYTPPNGTRIIIFVGSHRKYYYIAGISTPREVIRGTNQEVSIRTLIPHNQVESHVLACLLPPELVDTFHESSYIYNNDFSMCEAIGTACLNACNATVQLSDACNADGTLNDDILRKQKYLSYFVTNNSSLFDFSLTLMLMISQHSMVCLVAPLLSKIKKHTQTYNFKKPWFCKGTVNCVFTAVGGGEQNHILQRNAICSIGSSFLHHKKYSKKQPYTFQAFAIDSKNKEQKQEKRDIILNIINGLSTVNNDDKLEILASLINKVQRVIKFTDNDLVTSLTDLTTEELELLEHMVPTRESDSINARNLSTKTDDFIKDVKLPKNLSITNDQVEIWTHNVSSFGNRFQITLFSPSNDYDHKKSFTLIYKILLFIKNLIFFWIKPAVSENGPGKAEWLYIFNLYCVYHIKKNRNIKLRNAFLFIVDTRHAMCEKFYSFGKSYFYYPTKGTRMRKKKLRLHVFFHQYEVHGIDNFDRECKNFFFGTCFIRSYCATLTSSGTNTVTCLGDRPNNEPYRTAVDCLTEDLLDSLHHIFFGERSSFSRDKNIVISISKDVVGFKIAETRWSTGSIEVLLQIIFSFDNFVGKAYLFGGFCIFLAFCLFGYGFTFAPAPVVVIMVGLYVLFILLLVFSLKYFRTPQAILIVWVSLTYPILGCVTSLYWNYFLPGYIIFHGVPRLNGWILFASYFINVIYFIYVHSLIQNLQKKLGIEPISFETLSIGFTNWLMNGSVNFFIILLGIWSKTVHRAWTVNYFKYIIIFCNVSQIIYYLVIICYVLINAFSDRIEGVHWEVTNYGFVGGIYALVYLFFSLGATWSFLQAVRGKKDNLSFDSQVLLMLVIFVTAIIIVTFSYARSLENFCHKLTLLLDPKY